MTMRENWRELRQNVLRHVHRHVLTCLVIYTCTVIPGTWAQSDIPGWRLLSHSSSRAYLLLPVPLTWSQAEDTCQSLYGHLARDDPDGVLREYVQDTGVTGEVWVGLHQPIPQEPFRWVDDFSWLSGWTARDPPVPAGGGPPPRERDQLDQYHKSLCVALNVEQDFRWDTRYCETEKVANSVCQIEVPQWLRRAGQCELGRSWRSGSSLYYYPDNETLLCECEDSRVEVVCTIQNPEKRAGDSCCFFKNEDNDVDEIFEELFKAPGEKGKSDSSGDIEHKRPRGVNSMAERQLAEQMPPSRDDGTPSSLEANQPLGNSGELDRHSTAEVQPEYSEFQNTESMDYTRAPEINMASVSQVPELGSTSEPQEARMVHEDEARDDLVILTSTVELAHADPNTALVDTSSADSSTEKLDPSTAHSNIAASREDVEASDDDQKNGVATEIYASQTDGRIPIADLDKTHENISGYSTERVQTAETQLIDESSHGNLAEQDNSARGGNLNKESSSSSTSSSAKDESTQSAKLLGDSVKTSGDTASQTDQLYKDDHGVVGTDDPGKIHQLAVAANSSTPLIVDPVVAPSMGVGDRVTDPSSSSPTLPSLQAGGHPKLLPSAPQQKVVPGGLTTPRLLPATGNSSEAVVGEDFVSDASETILLLRSTDATISTTTTTTTTTSTTDTATTTTTTTGISTTMDRSETVRVPRKKRRAAVENNPLARHFLYHRPRRGLGSL